MWGKCIYPLFFKKKKNCCMLNSQKVVNITKQASILLMALLRVSLIIS
jgi:hypothetical protein